MNKWDQVNVEFCEMLTGNQILDTAQRVIWYQTPTSDYLKSVLSELNSKINNERVYKFPFILNSTKNWKKFVEEVLPVAYAEDSMRDIC